MKRMLYVAASLAIVGLLALAAGACGGDDDPTDDNGTPAAGQTPTIDPAGVVTPFPTPPLDGNNIVSDSKGYSATMPDGWRPRFNFIQTLDSSVDAYFEPLAPDAAVQSSITVTCTLERVENRIDGLKTTTSRLGFNRDITESAREIGGETAVVLSYISTSQQNPNQPELSKHDIFFSGDTCDYTVTTTASVANRPQLEPVFNAFIDSFELLP